MPDYYHSPQNINSIRLALIRNLTTINQGLAQWKTDLEIIERSRGKAVSERNHRNY